MSFATPLGLWALLALPAILALHLFRRRHRVRRVSGLFLFAATTLRAEAGPVRTRLLRSASLWLELAAALMIALWLGGLTLGGASTRRHLVIVLDDSASMSAAAGGTTTADRVRDALDGELSASDVVTIVRTGQRPTLLAGPRERAPLVRDALDAWTPRRPSHDPGPALALGLQLGDDATHLLYFTDTPTDTAPPEYEVRALGRTAPNVAITGARRVLEAGGERESLYLELRGYGGARRAEVAVAATIPDESGDGEGHPGERLVTREVALAPGAAVPLAFEGLPRTRGSLVVRLTPDALSIDDVATLLPPRDRTVGLWAGSLSAALRRELGLDRLLAALPELREAPHAEAAPLHLTERASDALPPGRVEVVIAPSGGATETWEGPFVLERRHPLLEGVALEGVYWAAGDGEVPGRPIVLAGNRPLVTVERGDESLRVRLDLDPRRGNLARAPDWPILFANVVEAARELRPGPRKVNVRLGDVIAHRPPEDPTDLTDLALVDPEGVRHPARGRRLITWDTERPGLHRLLDGEIERARFSVSFADERESNLDRCATETRPAERAPTGGGEAAIAGGAWESRGLALALLALLVADWLVLGGGLRRGTARVSSGPGRTA